MTGSSRSAPIFLTVALLLSVAIAQDRPCTGNANIDITNTYTWAEANETAAAAYPRSAHFSPAVCWLSNKAVGFSTGDSATPGFKIIAETGAPDQLIAELENNSDVVSVERRDGTPIGTSTGSYNVKFTATPTASYITCVSMIAPSPDWVVGITSMDMCDRSTGTWTTLFQKALVPYDAGTDSGETYVAMNKPTEPQATISSLSQGVIANYGYVRVTSTGGGAPSGTAAATSAGTTVAASADTTVAASADTTVAASADTTVAASAGTTVAASADTTVAVDTSAGAEKRGEKAKTGTSNGNADEDCE